MSDGVVVTGMALHSPYGAGLDAFWSGISSAEAAVHAVQRFPVDHWVYRAREAATIEEIGPERDGGSEQSAGEILSRLAAEIKTAAQIADGDLSRYETALAVGSSQNLSARFESYLQMQAKQRSEIVTDGSLQWLNSATWLAQLADDLGVGGPAFLVSTACTSGTSSIGRAYELVRDGRVTRAFAGGFGYFSEISFSGFNILKLIAKTGCRPFDAGRDGIMLGDAFALVALERESFARARAAPRHARIVGYGTGNEAYHPTSPDPSGEVALRVMFEALGRSPENVARLDYINAHGTGTSANDAAELRAIRRLLERRADPGAVSISSTKGHHGHALGAAGSIEFIATVLALSHGAAPPNAGLTEPAPEAEGLDLVRGAAKPRAMELALTNSFAFGGDTAAIALEAVR